MAGSNVQHRCAQVTCRLYNTLLFLLSCRRHEAGVCGHARAGPAGGAAEVTTAKPLACSLPTAGKKLAFVDTHALDQLAELLKRGCDIADGCGRPGWLPRMALNEKTFEEFKHVHDTILTILQVQLRLRSKSLERITCQGLTLPCSVRKLYSTCGRK